MTSPGQTIFEHVIEFEQRVIAEAIDGLDSDEFNRLMADAREELKERLSAQISAQFVAPDRVLDMIDTYFDTLPNPVADGARLESEVLPIRLKCEVTNVPIQWARYEYKGMRYSLCVYGRDNEVWTDGREPKEFTWKAGISIGAAVVLVLVLVFLG